MNKNMFKLSAIQAAVLVTLSGCGSDNTNSAPTAPNVAPTAANVMVSEAQQWVPVTGTLLGSDLNGDAITYGFTENGTAVSAEQGIYHFSHGQITLTGDKFTYTSISGQDVSIDYTVTAGGQSATAKIEITNVANDPLAYQQWHLRNTGQKSYALSERTKKGFIDLTVMLGRGTEEEQTAFYEALFAQLEDTELAAGEDINVVGAYAENVTGKGVTAVVVDTGLEIRHEDLIDNVLPNRSLNLNVDTLDRTDPTSRSLSGDHGTSVAGLIAAKGWNNIGTRGVAPDAGLIGMNYLGRGKVAQSDLLVHGFPGSGISSDEEISAFNRSYGLTYPAFISYSALDQAIESYPNLYLRSGKGALNMKSSGNSFQDDGGEGSLCSSNGAQQLGLTCYNGGQEPSQAHPYYLSIAAVNANGKHTSYSTAGSNLMVSAPAGEFGRLAPAMVTTDQMTCINGYSGFNGGAIAFFSEQFSADIAANLYPFNYPGHIDNPSCNYTSTFNGTSSAAPNASGVASLILSANPALTWRDVRHILASTSTKIDEDDATIELPIGEGKFVAHDGWVENSAGYSFNNLYGFGRVNAGAAVAMAKSYSNDMGEQVITSWQGFGSTVGQEPLTANIPDNDAAGLVQTIEVTEDIIVESMQFSFDIANSEMGIGTEVDSTVIGTDDSGEDIVSYTAVQTTAGQDLAIEVTSPSGTRSVLLSSKQALLRPAFTFGVGFRVGYILKDGVLMSNAFYGESAKGTWTVKVLDTSDANLEFAGGLSSIFTRDENNINSTIRLVNNSADSVLEGIALRAFGRAAQ